MATKRISDDMRRKNEKIAQGLCRRCGKDREPDSPSKQHCKYCAGHEAGYIKGVRKERAKMEQASV